MNADTFKAILATTASISTIFQFLTGIIICQKIARKRCTGDMSSFSFISGHLSTSLWLRYGFLIDDFSLIFVNTLGSTLFLGYTAVFYYYSVKKLKVLRQFLCCFFILIVSLGYSLWSNDRQQVTSNIGLLCCAITIMFFAAPLTSLLHVMRVKNTDSLPFPIIVASFMVSTQWYVYGVLLKDEFIKIPNFLGSILTLFQLSLFCVYSSKYHDTESV